MHRYRDETMLMRVLIEDFGYEIDEIPVKMTRPSPLTGRSCSLVSPAGGGVRRPARGASAGFCSTLP